MKTRRDFLRTAAVAGLLATDPFAMAETAGGARSASRVSRPDGLNRAQWCEVAERLSGPLLSTLAARELKKRMPVEAHPSMHDRAIYTHLEGVARLLSGIAPWLELAGDDSAEGRRRAQWVGLAREGIDAATDPKSPDFLNFSHGSQPLVDAAFLALALLRAPKELWEKLDQRVQKNVIAALSSSRGIKPYESNWQLFATTVEVFLHRVGVPRDDSRLFEGLRKHRTWYLGDGVYGDGPEFHWDYYNSFVIHPLLLVALESVAHEAAEWEDFLQHERVRFLRYADLQERLIAPDGSYPAIGRSITYRCGAFQVLAMAAQRESLPARIRAGQARVALSRVIDRTLGRAENFDAHGWLKIGLVGSQPELGEPYISTGSLYLCSAALLPLGLSPSAPFWSEPAALLSSERIWSGENMMADHGLRKQ